MAFYTIVRLLRHSKLIDEAGGIVEQVIWEVPRSDQCPDGIRYRLAYIPKGARRPLILYDNHPPKGHHKHIQDQETPYAYSGIARLIHDFVGDIERLK